MVSVCSAAKKKLVGGGGSQEQTQRHLRARWDKTVEMDFLWSRDEGVVNICEQ